MPGSRPFFTVEQDQEIVRRYRAGETLRAIGASYGMSYIPVRNALERCGVKRRGRGDYGWRDTPENRAELVRLWKAGGSVQKIAQQMGAGNDRVSRILREEGIQPRYGGQHHRFKGEQIAILVTEYEAGASLAELGRRYGGSVRVVGNTLQRAGVVLRRQGYRTEFWTAERAAWMADQVQSGRSLSSIAQEIGRAEDKVRRKLRDLKIVPPTPPAKGRANHVWKGGRHIDSGGYMRVLVPKDELHLAGRMIGGGYMLEHRLVMARILGRPLLPTETVHHIDGDKLNNDPGNLQLRQGRHGKGVMLQCADCGSHNVEAVPLT